MDQKVKKIVEETKAKLLEDLPAFLKLTDKKQLWELGNKMESYCQEALEQLKGKQPDVPGFEGFVDILYGCQQLDDYGEAWAPNEEKIKKWIAFLQKFSLT